MQSCYLLGSKDAQDSAIDQTFCTQILSPQLSHSLSMTVSLPHRSTSYENRFSNVTTANKQLTVNTAKTPSVLAACSCRCLILSELGTDQNKCPFEFDFTVARRRAGWVAGEAAWPLQISREYTERFFQASCSLTNEKHPELLRGLSTARVFFRCGNIKMDKR